jgi:RHS repeat-associated protein/uncharacterized repeat protein (TIGR01451 family)
MSFSPTRGKGSFVGNTIVETSGILAFLRQCVAVFAAGTFLLNGVPAKAESPVQETRAHGSGFESPARSVTQTKATVDSETRPLKEGRAFIHADRRRSDRAAYALGAESSRAPEAAAVVRPAALNLQSGETTSTSIAAAATESSASAASTPALSAQPPATRTLSRERPVQADSPLDLTSLLKQPPLPFSDSAFMMQAGSNPLTGTLAVSVGYADNLRPSSSFPIPWQGAPNVIFIGNGGFDAGAIRLDNLTNAPLTIDKVVVDVGRPGPFFDIWPHSITIPAQNSLILTQDAGENFDTSDFPIVGCGQPLSPNETRIPKVSITIAGVTTDFMDTGHVLDTGGFDLACQGNESLQWRPIGTTGIGNTSLTIALTPAISVQAAGVNYTATALVSDAANQPISNVAVKFTVLSGPNAGKTGTGNTNSQGTATFSYTSTLPGTDILQASVTNASGGTIRSEQVTNTWISAGPCPVPSQPPAPGTPVLLYNGQNAGEYSDPLALAAQLTDGSGNPLNGRSLSFAFAGQTFQATTNGNGIATVNIASAPAPGPVPLTVSFAGEASFNPVQTSTTVNIDRDETEIHYAGKTLLGTAAPQQVSALLTDGMDGLPIANKTLTFTVGTVTAQAVTNSNGVATATITLAANQSTGPNALQIMFAGDTLYKPSVAAVPVVVFLSTSFVVWGGNQGGLKLGQEVNFWGHSWADQVTGGNFNGNPSFKGFADPVNQVHVCEASAGSGGPLDDQCWRSKPGQSFPPPLTLPVFIQVIVSNAISKQGSEIFGNIAASAVCQVDPTPPYGPDPGKPGFCKLVAVIEDGGNVFPQPPALVATQDQPTTVLPGQTFNVTTTINNNSTTTADSVVVNESFDGVTPATGSQSFPLIVNGDHKTATFPVTTPVIPTRQSGESTVAYEQRLASVDGRLFTSTGIVSFTDALNEPFLPIPVSSFSRLQLPRLTLGVSGPSCVGPGSSIPYTVTITNIGSADAKNVALVMQLPDGSTTTVPIALIPVGTSVTSTINFVVPAITSKQPNETDQQYIARLQSIDGTQLTAVARATWQDASGNSYGTIEQQFISITERVPIVTTTPQGPAFRLPGETANLNFTTQNIGGGNASQVLLHITNPDGSIFSVPTFVLPAGQSTVANSSFSVPVVTAKQAGESDAAYQARLVALDNSALNFVAQLNWLDAAGNNYGPTSSSFKSTEVLPIITVSLTGPANATAGDLINYSLSIANLGHADATNLTVPVTLPDGSIVNPFSSNVLAAGATGQVSIPFAILRTQSAGQITAVATLNWKDANTNAYGPLTSTATTAVKAAPPVLNIAKTHSGNFTQGQQNAVYTVTVSNALTAGPTVGTVTVTDTLPSGLSLISMAGNGWACTANSCTRSDVLATGATYPAITVTVNVAANATSPQVNTVTVAGGSSAGASASDSTTIAVLLNTLVLAPAIAGPDVTGTSQTLTGTLKGSTGSPIVGASVQFTVTGVNPTTAAETTDGNGIATFSYSGANKGNDTVQATSGLTTSNQATVSWITPVQNISTSTVFARFYFSDGSGSFDTLPTATPAFTQSFPTINFNPPAGTVPGNTSGVGVFTRPFTNVTTDLNGNFTGTIVAQGNGFQAGVGSLFTFQAVFEGAFTVASAGDVVLTFFSDDGFVLGVGGGATRVSGSLLNPPPKTALAGLPVLGSFNTPTAPVANTIVLNFPAPGSYPYELDYTECCAGQLALTMAVGQSGSQGVPPTGSLALSPINPSTLTAGQSQTFTVQASDASGAPVPNTGVALVIDGANAQTVSATTDSTGHATFTYTGINAGTDSLQAVATISGLGAFSNIVDVNWNVTPGGGGGSGGTVLEQQGWIGAPTSGTSVQGQVPITVAAGITLTSGTLEFWPTSNPSNIHVLNANTTGSGTIGTFDATTLPNGSYTIQLQATNSGGSTLMSIIVVSVTGASKPGRFTRTFTDLKLPLAGIPVTISRTYDSLVRFQSGDFGFGWSLDVSASLSVDTSNDVTFTLNGRRVTFFFAPKTGPFPFGFLMTPNYLPEPGVRGTLTSDGCGALVRVQQTFECFPGGAYQPTTYTYTDPSGRSYTLGSDGSIKSIKDLNGNVLTFTPNGITSSATGVVVPFVRDSAGRITKITDPSGNAYVYSYDAAGNLAAVTWPGISASTTYGYSSDHLLLKVTGPLGNAASAAYYPDGRLQSTTDPFGNVTSYAYNLSTNTTTTTNPDGGVVIQTNNSAGNPISVTDPLNRTTTFTYDANQNLLTRTNPLGRTTSYTYDANGNVTTTTDALGNVITDHYDNFGELLQTTDALNHVYQLEHDGHGHTTALTDALGTLMGATYDTNGNRNSLTLPNGAVSKVTFDGFGNPSTVTDHGGFTINNQFDANGNLIAVSDSLHGSQIAFQFDALGRNTQTRDPLGNLSNKSYDVEDNLIATVDQNGNKVQYAYDADNRQTSVTYADSTTVKNTYDYAGRMLTSTNESGQLTAYTYDKAGELTAVTEASGTAVAATVSFTYDAAGRISSISDERNNLTQMTRDDDGRITSIKDPLGRVTSMAYDASGRLISETLPGGATTQYVYDARGRKIKTIEPDNTTVQETYTDATVSSITDEAGKTRSYTYDSRFEIASVTDPLGNQVQYVRNAVGNLTKIIDANGNTTTYGYDAADRVVSKTFPDGTSEKYTYDGNENLIARQLTDGHVNHFTYDSRDRLTGIQYFDGSTASFAYTATGKRKSATIAAGTTQYAYDGLDRLIKVTQPSGQTIAYAYDTADNVTSITSPSGTTQYTYDAVNRITSVTDPLGGVTIYTYDLAGRVTKRLLPNGVTTTYGYDVRNRLTSVAHAQGTTTPFESFQYALGPSGKRLSVVEADGTTTNWSYDNAYRLTSEKVTDASNNPLSSTSYTYDPAGNRTSVTMNGTTTTYTYNTLDQISTAGAAQYTYDARGNLTKINDPVAGVTTYGYDAANRMISAAVPVTPGSATYSYDADGRLVSRTTGGAVRNYVWNEVTEYGDILFETDGSGAVVSSYTMGGNDLIQQIGNGNTNPAYYLKDGLGSVVGLTDPNGVETDRYRYEAYGQRTLFQGTTVNPYGYRSQRVDDVTGLVYLRARYYGPRIGRFTIRDKSDFRLDDPIDLNRYAYAGGDPINNFDPTGNAAAEEEAMVLSAEEEDTIINSYFVGRFDKALFTWVVDFFAANLAAGAIEAAFPYGKRIVSYITIAFGFVLDVNIGTKTENAALRASNTPASRKILLGYASEFEADPGGFRFALSGTRKPWKRLAPIIAGFFGLDNSLDFGSDQCASHAERKIANGAKGTILSIAPSRPVCMTCWNALKDKVDVLAPLGLRWCKQDPNKP